MLPYNRSKIIGANPWLVRTGRDGGLAYGLNITGRTEPAQATNGTTDGAADLPLGPDAPATNIFRHRPIIAMVAECPWSEDEIGIPFDTDNIWAVRTRCCTAGLAGEGGDGGEVDWWTMVPRVLPVGYAFKGRSAIWGGIQSDFLGDFPLYGPATWEPFSSTYLQNIIRWREPREIDGFGASCTHTFYEWAPMNLSRLSLKFSSGSGWYTTGSGPTLITYDISHMGEILTGTQIRHVGFRGGIFPMTAASSGPFAPAGTVTAIIGYSDASTPTPSTMSDITTTWSEDITTSPTGNVSIGPCLAPASGAPGSRKYWHYITRTTAATGNRSSRTGDVQVSPRTDIPLWFTSITGNMVAPGGIYT